MAVAIARYPRAMCVVHLGLGMAAVCGGLTLARFTLVACIGGAALVPILWGWLWLTRRVSLVFMPINAALAGGALWWASTLTRADWEPTWSPLVSGLPLVGNLPVVLAALPLASWFWSLSARRWPPVFRPLNLLLAGGVLWFVLTRLWPTWTPYWAAFTAPVPIIPPVGLLLLLGPLAVWLWFQGQSRWPAPFIVANLLLLGGLAGLTGHHTRPMWDGTWRYWAAGLPFVAAPIATVSLAPASAWGWSRASRWKPTVFLIPNLILTGAVAWLVLDRTRPLWGDGWSQFWGAAPCVPTPPSWPSCSLSPSGGGRRGGGAGRRYSPACGCCCSACCLRGY